MKLRAFTHDPLPSRDFLKNGIKISIPGSLLSMIMTKNNHK